MRPLLNFAVITDCGSTVKRRGGLEGREEVAGAGDTDSTEVNKRSHEEDAGESWRSPSPPPSIDSGQSGQYVGQSVSQLVS